jgi:hypothetical protein
MVLLVIPLLCGLPSVAAAKPLRPDQIPNGRQQNCLNCHRSSGGGDIRNPFGRQVELDFLAEDGTVIWGPELAHLDSDGDGRTNGQELQDPDGAWRPGQPQPGAPNLVTNPGLVDAPAVPALTWQALLGLALGLLPALVLSRARRNEQ